MVYKQIYIANRILCWGWNGRECKLNGLVPQQYNLLPESRNFASGPCSSAAGGATAILSSVNQPSVAPTSLSASTPALCNGGNTTLGQTGGSLGTGGVWKWYTSSSYSAGSYVGDGTGANASLTVSPTTTTTYYLRAESSTGAPCAANVTGPAAGVTVAVSVPPAISLDPADEAVCASTPVSFSANATGTNVSYQWYNSSGMLSDGGTVSGATTATLYISQAQAGDIGDYYVIVTGSGGCSTSTVQSEAAHLAVNQAITVTSDPSDQTVCENSTVTFTVKATGNISDYQWMRNGQVISDQGNISGATSDKLTLSNVSTADDGTYDVIISGTDNSCAQYTSTGAVLTVNAKSADPTSATASVPALCGGGSSNLTLAGGGGGTNEVIKWYSDPSCISSSFIGSGNGLTVSPTATTTYYGRYEDGAPCNINSAAASVVVTVRPEFTSGAIATTGEKICYGGTPSAAIGSQTDAGGGDGTITYSWRSSVDGYTAAISGATSPTYTPPSGLTTTISYRRYAHDGSCNTTATVSTGTWTVTVDPQFTSGAIATTGETICYGGTPATVIGSQTDAGGGDGTITYSWRSSVDGYTADISGATSSTYTPPSGLTASTSYRRYAHDASCNTTATVSTGTWTVNVRPQFTPGEIVTTGETICNGGTPATAIGSQTDAGGGDESITYSWRSSADGYTAAISGATSSTYTPPSGLTTTTSYRRYAHDGSCNTTATVSSGTWTVTVSPPSVGGTLSIQGVTTSPNNVTSLCPVPNSATINLNGATGGITWYMSTDGGASWVRAKGDSLTNPGSLEVSGVNKTTIYQAQVKSGACSIAYSEIAVVSVIPPYVATDVSASKNPVCLGDNSTLTASANYTTMTGITDGSGDFNDASSHGWSWGTPGCTANSCVNASGDNTTPTSWVETAINRQIDLSKIYYTGPDKKFAIVRGSGLNWGNGDTSVLETPVFNLVAVGSASLSFYQGYNLLDANASISIEISTDGGNTYSSVLFSKIGPATYPAPTGSNNTNIILQPETISLTKYLGLSNLKIRFKFKATSGNSSWALDQIATPGASIPANYTWSGSDLSATTGTTVIATPIQRGENDFHIITSIGGCGQVGDVTIPIIADAPPSFIVNGVDNSPKTAATCVGSDATFTAAPSGDNVVFTWQKSTDGVNWTTVSGATYTVNNTLDPTDAINNSSTLTISPTDVGMVEDQYKLQVSTQNDVCPAISASAPILLNYVWKGGTSNLWSEPTNWYAGIVPDDQCTDVYILNKPNQPLINYGAPGIINLRMYPSAKLTIDGSGTLTYAGHIYNSDAAGGQVIARLGSVNMDAGPQSLITTKDQSIDANTFQNNDLNNLNFDYDGARTITLNDTKVDALKLYGVLSFTGGGSKNFISNGGLTLRSIAASTARVADITNGSGNDNTGNKITGDVTVERYFPALQAWRFLAIPTIPATQTVKDAWQEGATTMLPNTGGNPVPGYGMVMTSVSSNWASAGFDRFSAGSTSAKWYEPYSNTFVGMASTNLPFEPSHGGYLTFVRGDRTVINGTMAATSTTLRTAGHLYQGNQPQVTILADPYFTPVSNPFASPLDLRSISRSPEVSAAYIVYDPKLGTGSAYGYGAYQTLTKGAGPDPDSYYPTPGGGSYPANTSIPSNFIESGQAWFMQTAVGTGAGSINLTETSKGTGSGNLVFKTASPNNAILQTNLKVILPSNSETLDGVMNQFGDEFTNKLDGLDIKKMINTGESLSILSQDKLLAVERKHTISEEDTIFLHILHPRVNKYSFEINAAGLNKPGLTAYLEDTYLKTKTPVDLSGKTEITFNIANVPGSYNPDRFRIVFRQEKVVPVSFISVEGNPKDKDVEIKWKVVNEKFVSQYEIEKSGDGSAFKKVGSTDADLALFGNYNWLDINASEGFNYYRIKCISLNGDVTYSDVIKVYITPLKQSISVYPNPITDGVINLQLIHQPKGKYGVRLVNDMGQTIMTRVFDHSGVNGSERLKWNYNLSHGTYHLEITKPDGSKTNIVILY